ncbi:MAG: hypothetical protein AABM67_20820 [Acidobacteriota bacterium]
MLTLKRITFASMLIAVLLATAAAQESNNAAAQRSTLTITASAAAERVRITAPASVVQMRIEVYGAGGEKLVDQEIRGGNVFDWHLQGGQGQRLAPGTYVCVVTAKSVSGRLTQKIGTVQMEENSVSVRPADAQRLSAQQSQTIGPMEEDASWTTPAGDEQQTPTVIAHDGTDGQMIRGRGALTFRVGNFFTGNDKEQMRLTEDGRLGIGTSDPKGTLDVAGTIRAQRFVRVRPQTTSFGKTTTNALTTEAEDPGQLLLTGTGTQDRIAKWLDNAGTLGDSTITETGGFVGIGTTVPGSKLVVSSNSSTLPPASGITRFADADGIQTAIFADSFGTNPIFNVRRANGTAAAPSAVQANQLLGVIGASAYGATTYSGTRARVAFWAAENWTDTANGTYLTFNTTSNGSATPGGAERLRVDSLGRVGIGTSTPGSLLDVAGDLNVTGNAVVAGNIAAKYQDVAEWVDAAKPIAPATLVILDPARNNAVVPSVRSYDTTVAGVISAQPGLILGEGGAGKVLVATTGRVKVKVDATRHAIKIGDLLVASDKPGVAMKSVPIIVKGVRIHRPGTIIGKALEPLSKGTGEIAVLLSLQ